MYVRTGVFLGCSDPQLVSEAAPHQDHLTCRTVEAKVEVLDCGGLETCRFVSDACPPYIHLTEQETQDVSQLFRMGCVGDTPLEAIE